MNSRNANLCCFIRSSVNQMDNEKIHKDLTKAIQSDDWETVCKFLCVHTNESEAEVLKRGFVQGWKECRRIFMECGEI